MAGMIFFGLACDILGRKNASTITALLELVGVGVMAFFASQNLRDQAIVIASFFGIFGMGVGGEYPLTAYGAAQHYFKDIAEKQYEAETNDREKMRKRIIVEQVKTARRGETISLIFTMQGIGAVFGSAVLLVLIYFSGQGKVEWYEGNIICLDLFCSNFNLYLFHPMG